MNEPKEIEDWFRISILGSGAFGVVTLWKHQVSHEYIAIKKCKFEINSTITAKQRARWENEVEHMKSMKHSNIIAYKTLPEALNNGLDRFNPTKLPLLSMEYCTKGNLRRVLNQLENSCGLAELEVRTALEDISRAIMYLHSRKITHRDIKPENIVLQNCNFKKGGTIYKLIDLGYAKELNDSVVSFVGTLHYLAPEIMRTQNYNCSVDYWSFGVTAFEIICGVLPFLPQMTPFERFDHVLKKRPEHICIYQLQSGSVAYSSELLKENHISSCLKQNLEIWLRHVLQHDAKARMDTFSDGSNVFDNLLKILKKPIIKVFSVYTLEFYSYEVNEGTLVGTLKDWIARDTKVDKNNQVVLTSSEFGLISDEKLVVDILGKDLMVYVFNKGYFFNRDTFSTPKSVRILFESDSKFTWRELRPLYQKVLFFLTQEAELLGSLMKGVRLFIIHMKMTSFHLLKVFGELHREVSNLSVKSECYFNLRSSSHCQNSGDYRKSLEKFKSLIGHVEIALKNVNSLLKKVEEFYQRQIILDKRKSTVNSAQNIYANNKSIHEAADLISKHSNTKSEESATEMKRLLSRHFKSKDKVLFNKDFKNYTEATSVAIRDNYDIVNCIDKFKNDIKVLSRDLDNNEKGFYNLLSCKKEPITKQYDDLMVNGTSLCDDLDALSLINENKDLRVKFEQTMNMLMLRHKIMSEECQVYLKQKY